jgi:putative nucleotidyltransferase with HDIG domain
MTLLENVYTKDGNLLMPKDAVLTERYINKLIEFGISRIDIDGQGIYDGFSQEFDEVYNSALVKIKDTFLSVKHRKAVIIEDYEPIVNSFLESSKMGRNLIAYMKIVDNKDDYIFQHSLSVCVLSILMGRWLGYDEANLKILGLSAILHDIGKIVLPDGILNKSDKLTPEEYNIVKNHTRMGFQILRNSKAPDEIIPNTALTHHERVDGKGYPFGLQGTALNEKVRIVSICDVFDAVTSERPYKKQLNPLRGFKVISDNSYKGLDPYLCKVFLNNGAAAFHGYTASLSDGRMGKIIRISPENPTKPWIVNGTQLINLEAVSDLEVEELM